MENKLFIDIVQYTIIIIFACTAILALLSIPNWIKIEEWYKKKLFTALIIEVIAAVMATYTLLHKLPGNTVDEATLNIPPKTKISVSPIDTSGHFNILANDSTVATLFIDDLKLSGFFNSLETETAKATIIKWEKKGGEKWAEERPGGKTSSPAIPGCPYYVILKDSLEETNGKKEYKVVYQIYEEGINEPVICSFKDSEQGLHYKDKRTWHFLSYTDTQGKTNYALFYIIRSNLDQKDEEGRPIGSAYFYQRIIKAQLDFRQSFRSS